MQCTIYFHVKSNLRLNFKYMCKIATIKEVQQLLPELSKSSISRKIQLLRDALNKPKPKIVTIDEFKMYYDIQSE